MTKILSFADAYERKKLEKIRHQLNSSLGLNLSEGSVRYLMTPPGDIDGQKENIFKAKNQI